jgi:phosphatidate cytidylyltransferase
MTRVLSGVALAAAALAAILVLPAIPLRIVASLVAVIAAHEYLKIVGGDNSYVGGVAIVTWMIPLVSSTLAFVPVVVLFIAGLSALQRRRTGQLAITSAFALIYIAVPIGMLASIHDRFGAQATLLLIATVVVSDSLQYYTGRMLGRRPLAPTISPKKTIEGAVGGIVAGTAFMALVGPLVFPANSRAGLAVLGLVMVITGIVGDLFESRLKREADVKDSSTLIPGHGGILDRIDALLFVTPVFFLYVLG